MSFGLCSVLELCKNRQGVERHRRSNRGMRPVCGVMRGPSLILLWEGAVPPSLIQTCVRFLIVKRHIFVDCYALKYIFITKRCKNTHTHGMDCGWWWTCDNKKQPIHCQWYELGGLRRPPMGLKFTRARGRSNELRGFNPPLPPNVLGN